MYGVSITDVRTMNYGGGKSSVKYTNKGIVEQPSKQWKKAVVTVAVGETIDLFNNF
jgi:large subunit ribosomal protein L23